MRRINHSVGIMIILINSVSIYGQKTNNSISIIDIERNMNKMEIINLSQYSSNIRYIPLKTKSDQFISNISGCVFSGNRILIRNLRECLLFDNNGNLLSKIGSQGRGPGEYQFVVNAAFDSKSNIYIQSLRDLIAYRIDGSFVKKYDKLFMFNNGMDIYFSNWIIIDDSLIFGHIPNTKGNNSNKALLINKAGRIIKYYKNYDLFTVSDKKVLSSSESYAYIQQFDKLTYYKGANNDTVFLLNNKFNLIPQYVFNFGKFKMPESEKAIAFGQKPTTSKYLFVWYIFQTDDYLLFDCNFGDNFPAKRLTPKKINLPSGQMVEVWHNTQSILGIYNKKTRTLSFCKPTNTDNPLFTSGLYNDIDGGPRFFPKEMVNDSTMVMWIEVKQLKDHIATDDFKRSTPKFPEKKKQFEELVKKLDDIDNPVLMFVTIGK